MAHGVLIPCSGIEFESCAVEAWSLNHWTSREVPGILIYSFWLREIYKYFGDKCWKNVKWSELVFMVFWVIL